MFQVKNALYIVKIEYLFEIYGNIDDQNTSLYLSIKIKTNIAIKYCLKRDINDLMIFYFGEKDNLNLVR